MFLQQALSLDTCERLIDEYESCPEVKQKRVMSLDAFHAMFNGPELDVFDSVHHGRIHQDMSHPLSHYFIDSSHNTCVAPVLLPAPINQTKRPCFSLKCDQYWVVGLKKLLAAIDVDGV